MKRTSFKTFLWVLYSILYAIFRPIYLLYHWILLRDLALWDEDAYAKSTPSKTQQKEEKL